MTKQKATLLLIASALLFLLPVVGYLNHKVSFYESFETDQRGGVSGYPSVRSIRAINFVEQYLGYSRPSDAVIHQFREWLFYFGLEPSEVSMPLDASDSLFKKLDSPELTYVEKISFESATLEQYRSIGKKQNCRSLFIHADPNLNREKLIAIAENFPALERLSFGNSQVEWSAFDTLSNLPIKTLEALHCSIRKNDAEIVASALPEIERLNIGFNFPEAAIPFLKLKSLSTINLYLSGVTEEFLRSLENSQNLKTLVLFGNEKSPNHQAISNIFGIPTQSAFTLLEIHGISSLTQIEVEQMAASFPNLASIWITAPRNQSMQVEVDALNAFKKFAALKHLALPDAELIGNLDTEIHLPIDFLALHEFQIPHLNFTSETERAINKALAHPSVPWALTNP